MENLTSKQMSMKETLKHFHEHLFKSKMQ